MERSISCVTNSSPDGLRTVSERLELIYKSGFLFDWTFHFHDDTKIKAHKLMLALHSPVYEKMFFGSFPCSNEQFVSVSKQNAVQWIMDYIYKGSIIIHDVETAIELYIFAHEYQIDLIVARSSTFLCSRVDNENVLELTELAMVYQNPELMTQCEEIIYEKKSCVFSTLPMEIMSRKVMWELIDKASSKGRISDFNIFHIVYKWAKAQVQKEGTSLLPENIRSQMDPLLPLVNFQSVSIQDFLTGVVPTEIFSATECLDHLRLQFKESSPILLLLSCTKLQNHNMLMKKDCKVQSISIVPKPACNFSFFLHNRHEIITERIVVIEASEKIFLRSVRANRSCYVGKWLLQVLDPMDQMIATTSNNDGPPWTFDKLVPIKARQNYTIKVHGKGTRTKHTVIPFNSTLNEVSFVGVSIGCSIQLEYWTSIDEFIP